MTDFPIVNDDGEVIAADEEQRRLLAEQWTAELLAAESKRVAAAVVVNRMRNLLALLLTPQDGVFRDDADAWQAYAKDHQPNRKVDEVALQKHAEALHAIGLGIREETRTVTERYVPSVGELTGKKARALLADEGLTPEQLLHKPPTEVRLVVERVKDA